MNQPVQISNGWVAAVIAAIVFDILYPLALGAFARRRLGVSWRYFGYGALIFVLFQLVSRVPITLAIQALIAPQLQASRVALIAWIAISALTAGLFEELGRYVGYRWLMKREQKTWAKGVMYGLGHGGIESMLLIAGASLLVRSFWNLTHQDFGRKGRPAPGGLAAGKWRAPPEPRLRTRPRRPDSPPPTTGGKRPCARHPRRRRRGCCGRRRAGGQASSR